MLRNMHRGFLDALWGSGVPRTFSKNLSSIKDFFRFQIVRGRLHGDPTLLIERARSRQVYRTSSQPSSAARSSPSNPTCATGYACTCCSITAWARARSKPSSSSTSTTSASA